MTAHGFRAEEDYVDGLIESFASHDDGDWLTRADFAAMRGHLNV